MKDGIFKQKKTEYENPSILLGEAKGLFDTINKPFPRIWKHYKTLKSLDWDENEVDYSSCNVDFKTCSKSTYDAMIKTLAWQWEADSVAAHHLIAILAPVTSSSEALAAWTRVADNEVLHAAAYSEIVRGSFDDPSTVLEEILQIQESIERLETVSIVIAAAKEASSAYSLDMVENDEALYSIIYLFIVAMLILERIQFMSSFAVTFSICDTGLFVPFGKIVQKIAQDELEVHVQLGKDVLYYEHKTERGKNARKSLEPTISRLISEVVESELKWVDYLFSEGRSLVGLNADILKKWVLFNAADIYRFFGIKSPYELPTSNPLKYMEQWLNMNLIQPAPQEEDVTAYKVGVMRRDDEDIKFNVEF